MKYPSESIRNMCLLGGAASMLSSLLGVIDIFGLASPIHYICNFYLLVFGATCVILEYGAGSFDRLGVIPIVDTYFKALTFVWGRGLFYIFQGTPQRQLSLPPPHSVSEEDKAFLKEVEVSAQPELLDERNEEE
jgi:hypothetical protein